MSTSRRYQTDLQVLLQGGKTEPAQTLEKERAKVLDRNDLGPARQTLIIGAKPENERQNHDSRRASRYEWFPSSGQFRKMSSKAESDQVMGEHAISAGCEWLATAARGMPEMPFRMQFLRASPKACWS